MVAEASFFFKSSYKPEIPESLPDGGLEYPKV